MIDEPKRHVLAVAPMMDRTDRHCRYFLRLIAPNAWLYTEMITAMAVVRGSAERLLRFDRTEHPVAAQLGGSDPELLAQAARAVAAAGYDEVNLNVGCPSDRVQAGSFGAALMADPRLVADCVRAMREASGLPVTVKTRIGIDELDSYAFLSEFVAAVADAGCATLFVHARKAWLEGLSPKQNRTVPPLDYARVRQLHGDFPRLEVVLNGGLDCVAGALEQLRHVDGIMLGRAAYRDPFLLGTLDAQVFGHPPASRERVFEAMLDYAERECGAGTPLHAITRHMVGLYAGRPGARHWRRALAALDNDPMRLRHLWADRYAEQAA